MIATGRLVVLTLVALPVGAGNLHAQDVVPDPPTIYRDGYGVPHVFGPTDRPALDQLLTAARSVHQR